LAEILAKPYADPEIPSGSNGLDSGETSIRNTFDDVDDYDNWVESPPLDSAGQAMAGYNGWTREVWVVWAARTSGDPWMFYDTGLKRVQVRVTAANGTVTDRYGYRWREGALKRSPPLDTEVITWVGAELQLGASGLARAGTNLLNASKD